MLDEELGLEPSAELRDLQTAVLRQDPASSGCRRAEAAGRRRAPAAGTVAGGRAAGAAPADEPVAPWPMVGRDADLAALVGAGRRRPSRAPRRTPSLTGDPGIGKSRLAAELVAAGPAARASGCWSAGAPRTTARRRCGRGRRCSTGSA